MVWRRGFVFALALAPLAVASTACADDAPPFDWGGLYLGYHLGGALGLADVDNPFGPSIFGGTVRTPGPLAGGQAGYNWQHGAMLYGFEADASFADLDGTNTCFAYSGYYVSANCRANIDALGTFTSRLGWVLPSDGRTLIFGKAGLAWAHTDIEAIPNGGFGLKGNDDSGVEWGWTVGGGIERAITSRWTVKGLPVLRSKPQRTAEPVPERAAGARLRLRERGAHRSLPRDPSVQGGHELHARL